MTDIVIGSIPANTIFKRMGLTECPDGLLAVFLEFETEDGALRRRVMVPDSTQLTGYLVVDTVVNISSDFTISVGTLDEESEQTQT